MPNTEAKNVVVVRGSGQRHKRKSRNENGLKNIYCSVPEHLKQRQVQPSIPADKTEGLTGGQGEFGEAWAEEAPEE